MRQTGFTVGVVCGRQAEVAQAKSAGFDHPVQGGEIVTVLKSVLCRTQNHGGGIGLQSLKPQPLYLFDLFSVRPCGVVLVVVVEAKQRKYLIDRLNQVRVRRLDRFSWPSWCR